MSAPRKPVAGPLAATIAVGLVVGVGAGFGARFLTTAPKPIDGPSAAQAVEGVLGDDYGLSDATGTRCPASVDPEPGTTFQCTATTSASGFDGSVTVTVTVLNEAGQLNVGAPR